MKGGTEMKKLNIAIIGQGRSGRNIHGKYFKSENNKNFNVVAVVDSYEDRRELALQEYPGCEVFETYQELYGRDDIDLVVNATYSDLHYSVTHDLLENGFNVVVEKPFARNRYECDTLIKLAEDKGVKLGVFQQSLFAPVYRFAKDVIASGKLGDIKQIYIGYCNLARRWDWQTTQLRMGGGIYNTGPHPIGYALGFLDFDDNVKVAFSKLDTALTSGDSDDYAKIILTAPEKPVVDIEVISVDAYPSATIKIIGSKGTYKSDMSKYEMKYIVDGENPERPVVLEPIRNDENLPAYCGEELKTHEESGEMTGSAFDVGTACFYDMMYNAIVNNAEMEIPPVYAAKVISIIEQVHAENPLPIKILGE